MGIFDRFKRKKAPQELVSTQVINIIEKMKAQLGYTYGYGGSASRYGSGSGSKWDHGLSNSGSSPILNHVMLRQNSRSAYHDSHVAKAIVDRFADTVGAGLTLESTPDAQILGLTTEQAEEWGDNFSGRFDLWADSKQQHRAGLMTFKQAHRLYQINNNRDGDQFIRLFYSRNPELLNPLQFDFIDPNQIRGDGYTSTYAPLYQMDGIIRDSQGREKQYLIWELTKAANGTFKHKSTTINRVTRFGRVNMLHCFTPEYPQQLRGYPRISHLLQDFENLTDFKMAQIKKAINQSNITMYTKPSENEDAPNPFEGILTNHGAGPIVEQFGENATPDPTALNVDRVNYCPLPEATLDTPGSVGVFNLTSGSDLKPFENTAPSDSFDSFVGSFVSYLCASVSMPFEVLLMKFNQNYSASRAALILFWRIANIWKQEMASDFLNPITEMYAAGEIAAGRLIAPGWSNPILKAAWLKNNWIGEPMPNIDQQKTAKADEMYINMGAQTLDRVSRNLNGSSGKANRAQLAREFKELPKSPFNPIMDIEEGKEKEKGDD